MAATRALQAGLGQKGAGRGAGRPGWDDAGGDKGHDEDANQQQFVPDWTKDASGQWIWADWDRWRWTDARGWWQVVPMQ